MKNAKKVNSEQKTKAEEYFEKGQALIKKSKDIQRALELIKTTHPHIVACNKTREDNVGMFGISITNLPYIDGIVKKMVVETLQKELAETNKKQIDLMKSQL